MVNENVAHMSGTPVTHVSGLYTHRQGISFMAGGAYNLTDQPREPCERRGQAG